MNSVIDFPVVLKNSTKRFWQSRMFWRLPIYLLLLVLGVHEGIRKADVVLLFVFFATVYNLLSLLNDLVYLNTIAYKPDSIEFTTWLGYCYYYQLSDIQELRASFLRGHYRRRFIEIFTKDGKKRTISIEFNKDKFEPIFIDLYHKGKDVFIY